MVALVAGVARPPRRARSLCGMPKRARSAGALADAGGLQDLAAIAAGGQSRLEQVLITRRRSNAAFTATGLVHHSDAGSHAVYLTRDGGGPWTVSQPLHR